MQTLRSFTPRKFSAIAYGRTYVIDPRCASTVTASNCAVNGSIWNPRQITVCDTGVNKARSPPVLICQTANRTTSCATLWHKLSLL